MPFNLSLQNCDSEKILDNHIVLNAQFFERRVGHFVLIPTDLARPWNER